MKTQPVNEYFGSGDATGEVSVKKYTGFKLFETWEYRTMTKTSVDALFENGKVFQKQQNENWKRIA